MKILTGPNVHLLTRLKMEAEFRSLLIQRRRDLGHKIMKEDVKWEQDAIGDFRKACERAMEPDQIFVYQQSMSHTPTYYGKDGRETSLPPIHGQYVEDAPDSPVNEPSTAK